MLVNPPPPPAPIPSLLTQLETIDIPKVYRRFAEIVGDKHWNHRAAQMRAEIKGNRFLTHYLHDENDIAFGLERCGRFIERYGNLPVDLEATRTVYPALGFAAQALSMMDLASNVEAERLRKRIEGALKSPNNMRSLRLELTAATHFARRGHRLEWPEMTGGGTFDLLVPDMGTSGLEVECKSVSDDKGRNIHRSAALAFHHLLTRELGVIPKKLRVGLAVVLTVPGRLPTRHDERKALAKRVRQQITIGHSASFDDGSDIRIAEFDSTRLEHVVHGNRPEEVVREVVEGVTGTQNRECMLVGTKGGGALAFVLQSAIDDDFLDSTFRTLGDAGREQLTGTRPGILIAGFDGLNAEQLLSIAGQDHDPHQEPTALVKRVSRFLSSDNRDNVVGVGFLSRSALAPVENGAMDYGGMAYYFPKRESPFWHEDFTGIFTPRSHPV